MVTFLNYSHSNDDTFYQPNYTRSRSALRSPLNSERWNLEMGLFLYDVSRLYTKLATSSDTLETNFATVVNGFSESSSINWSEDATPEAIVASGLEALAEILKGYRNRLDVLEKGLANG